MRNSHNYPNEPTKASKPSMHANERCVRVLWIVTLSLLIKIRRSFYATYELTWPGNLLIIQHNSAEHLQHHQRNVVPPLRYEESDHSKRTERMRTASIFAIYFHIFLFRHHRFDRHGIQRMHAMHCMKNKYVLAVQHSQPPCIACMSRFLQLGGRYIDTYRLQSTRYDVV